MAPFKSSKMTSFYGVRVLGRRYECALEVSTHHSLEAGVELREERWFVSLGQDSLLHHRTFNIVILNHNVFLQDLDGVQLLC